MKNAKTIKSDFTRRSEMAKIELVKRSDVWKVIFYKCLTEDSDISSVKSVKQWLKAMIMSPPICLWVMVIGKTRENKTENFPMHSNQWNNPITHLCITQIPSSYYWVGSSAVFNADKFLINLSIKHRPHNSNLSML